MEAAAGRDLLFLMGLVICRGKKKKEKGDELRYWNNMTNVSA